MRSSGCAQLHSTPTSRERDLTVWRVQSTFNDRFLCFIYSKLTTNIPLNWNGVYLLIKENLFLIENFFVSFVPVLLNRLVTCGDFVMIPRRAVRIVTDLVLDFSRYVIFHLFSIASLLQ